MSITIILGLLGSFVGAIVGAKRTKANALYSLIAVAIATAILAVLQLTAFNEVISQFIYIAVTIAVAFGLGLRRWQLLAVLAGAFIGAFAFGFVGGAIDAILHAGQNRSG